MHPKCKGCPVENCYLKDMIDADPESVDRCKEWGESLGRPK